jgi:predicted transcriptional regulator
MYVDAIIKYRLREKLMNRSYRSSEMLEYYAVSAVKEVLGEEAKPRGYYSLSHDTEMLVLQLESDNYYIDIYYTVKEGEYRVIWCTVKKREFNSSSSPHQLSR